jgi:cation:H+ antiporter
VSSLGAIALLIAGIVFIVAGAELLFDGLVAAATRLDVSAFALSLVVSGLELENLAAGIAANAKGLSGAAAGTFLGGTTFLALAVAGVGALIAPLRAELPRSVIGWLLAAPLPLLLVSVDGHVSRLEGAALVGWFGVAMVGMARSGGTAPDRATEVGQRPRPLLRLLAGLGVLTGGGALLADGIGRAVRDLGVSQTLLGNTAIAAGVEAEEVARVAVPARRGRGDVALANVAGTIVHFTALNAGVIALVRPLSLDAASLHLHLPASVCATAALCVALWIGGGVGRATGALFFLLYLVYVAAAIVFA